MLVAACDAGARKSWFEVPEPTEVNSGAQPHRAAQPQEEKPPEAPHPAADASDVLSVPWTTRQQWTLPVSLFYYDDL